MKKLYDQIPYIKTFEAEVISCRPGRDGEWYEAVLDQTAFYPEGGGQPSDTGSLGDARVLEVRERDGEVVHRLSAPLQEGERVTGTLDWERRFGHMQNHTGEHMLSGLVHKYYGFDNVGFHMGKDAVTVDFNGVLAKEQVLALEREANDLIYANVPVITSYPSREELAALDYRSKKDLHGQVRIVTIPGGDVCACCGTHVERTGEVGVIKIIDLANYKGGVRITMLCGRQAVEDYERRIGQVSAISGLLSAKPGLIVEAVQRLKEEDNQKAAKIGRLYQQLFEAKARKLPEGDSPLAVFEEDLEPLQLRQYCTLLVDAHKGGTVLACSRREEVFQYALGSASADMKALGKSMNTFLSGRGGGNGRLVQGTFGASREEIESVFWRLCTEQEENGGDENGIK